MYFQITYRKENGNIAHVFCAKFSVKPPWLCFSAIVLPLTKVVSISVPL